MVVDVVVGVNHPDKEGIAKKVATRPSTYLHSGLPTLSGLMARADLMVSAGGSTSWERMCLGLPGIVISIADNQKPMNEALQRSLYIEFLGDRRNVTVSDIADAVRRHTISPELMRARSMASQNLVLGLGSSIVCDALLHSIGKPRKTDDVWR